MKTIFRNQTKTDFLFRLQVNQLKPETMPKFTFKGGLSKWM